MFSKPISIVLLLGLALIVNGFGILQSGFFRFKRTKKALLICLIHFALLVAYFYFYPTPLTINLIYIASPFILVGIILAFAPVTKLAKEFFIREAKKKLVKMPNLKVIGITGSYGKSSTKEFLYQILSGKYKVLKTPKNINTDIGVARIVLNQLKDEHEVFIVEMGAYKIGEIANICKMKAPDIGILTAVSNQHISLFGSLDNIKKAKGELLESVSKDGVSITNADNSNCLDVIDRLKIEALTYGENGTTKIKEVQQNEDTLSFKADDMKVDVKVIGPYQAWNITAAIIAAQKLGMTDSEIKSRFKEIKSPEAVLSIKTGFRKSLILDDSYNSNPDGFLAAINVAKDQKVQGKKILITMGMIELGVESDAMHKQVGELANNHFDEIIVIRKEAYRPFQTVIPDSKLRLIEDPETLLRHLKKTIGEYDLILIENRLYKNVLNFLLEK